MSRLLGITCLISIVMNTQATNTIVTLAQAPEELEESILNILLSPDSKYDVIAIGILEEESECDEEESVDDEWVSDTIFLTTVPDEIDPLLDLIVTGKQQ